MSCAITSDKENVTVAVELSLSQSEQVLETEKCSRFNYPAAHGHLSLLEKIIASQI